MLDAFRGFAAVWVVLLHSVAPWIENGNQASARSPFYAFSLHGQLGVFIFFVISGYCIAAAAFGALISGKSIWRYFYERVRRIYPPYLAALLLAVSSAALLGFAESHRLLGAIRHTPSFPHTFRYWFANIFLLQYELKADKASIVFWSLGYEVAFYLIIGLILMLAKWIAARRGLYGGIVAFVVAVGASTVASLAWLFATGERIFPFDLWHQFSIGAWLFFLLEFNPRTVVGFGSKLRRIILVNGVILTILMVAAYFFRRDGSGICLVFCALLISIRRFDRTLVSVWAVKPLLWIGAFSYSLYLVHDAAIPYVDYLCRRVGLVGHLYWIAVVLQVAFSLVIGYFSFLLVERHFISKRQVSKIKEELVSPSALPRPFEVET